MSAGRVVERAKAQANQTPQSPRLDNIQFEARQTLLQEDASHPAAPRQRDKEQLDQQPAASTNNQTGSGSCNWVFIGRLLSGCRALLCPRSLALATVGGWEG